MHEVGLLSNEEKIVTPFDIKEEKFSAHHKLIRVTAWCNRFISQEPLTPAHFISVNRKTGIPDIEIEYSPQENLSTTLLDVWKMWSDEYLQSLREKQSLKMKPVKGEVNRIPGR